MRSSWLYFAMRSVRHSEPVLIWPASGADREVGDRRVLGLARAVGADRAEARRVGHVDRLERLRERADLVDLDQDRVRRLLVDAALQDGGVRHEEVVADELAAVPELLGHELPARPVVLGEAVLDRDDRVRAQRSAQYSTMPASSSRASGPRRRDGIRPSLVELARGRVERDRDVAAGLVAGASIAWRISSSASTLLPRFGAKPPSSPTAVERPSSSARSSARGRPRRPSAGPRRTVGAPCGGRA
jgi:hypothetical protein